MSCNPAIGGVAKGVVAREVDALGGVMGRATDAARIQFRMLNRSKGPAVWGPRAQCDRALYPLAVRRILDELPSLDLFQEMVTGLLVDDGRVVGVRTRGGSTSKRPRVVVTTGTFLRGRIHVGGECRRGRGPGRRGPFRGVWPRGSRAWASRWRASRRERPPAWTGAPWTSSAWSGRTARRATSASATYVREKIPEQRPCWITWAGDALKRRRAGEPRAQRAVRREHLGAGTSLLPVHRGQDRALP